MYVRVLGYTGNQIITHCDICATKSAVKSIFQGKPTEHNTAIKATEYGQLVAPDYIPGAEVLPGTDEVTEEKKDNEGISSQLNKT